MDDVKVWKERIRCAPDEELVAFRESDYLGLTALASHTWDAVIDATEDELRRRGFDILNQAAKRQGKLKRGGRVRATSN